MSTDAGKRTNVAGIGGLSMVVLATLLSPTGFLGITLPFLIILGFGGLVVCGVSLAWRPRWPGVVGLTLGILCVAGWIGFFGWAFLRVQNSAGALGLSVVQHSQMCMSAMALTEVAESQRTPTGGAATSVVVTSLDPTNRTDPWGRPYRYAITRTARGFTFVSDGPDGVAGTSDDIDILTIQRDGMFQLPPISRPTTAAPATAPAGSATNTSGSGAGGP